MSETKFPIRETRRPTVLDDGIPLCSHMVCPKFSPTQDSRGECSDNDGRSPADAGHLCYPELRALLKPPLKNRTITRTMLRCRSCRAWWSVHPSEVMRPKPCPCGGELAPEMPPEVPYVPHKPPPPGSAPSQ